MQTNELVEKIRSLCGEAILTQGEFRDELTVTVRAAAISPTLQKLRDNQGLLFKQMIDITAVDYADKQECRFEVIYHLYSHLLNVYLRVKAPLKENADTTILPEIDSVVSLWRTADWLERETYDMFGINFVGHPNLKRILMNESMQGYPLRKDFPLHGPPEWPIVEEQKKRLKKVIDDASN